MKYFNLTVNITIQHKKNDQTPLQTSRSKVRPIIGLLHFMTYAPLQCKTKLSLQTVDSHTLPYWMYESLYEIGEEVVKVVLEWGLSEVVEHSVTDNGVEVLVHTGSLEKKSHSPGPNLKLKWEWEGEHAIVATWFQSGNGEGINTPNTISGSN